MNGLLKFSPKWFTLYRPLFIAGGPYDEVPKVAFGVCLREALPRGMEADVWLPIQDFSVPEDPEALDQALKAVLVALLQGEFVYVGCLAGRGRTGLFLALLTKIIEPDYHPVDYVRARYFSHAVETEKQMSFVRDFDAAPYRKWMFWAAIRLLRGKEVEAGPSLISNIAPSA